MGILISIVVALLVVSVVLWATQRVLAAFSVPPPINTVILVLVVLLCLFWALGFTGLYPQARFWR